MIIAGGDRPQSLILSTLPPPVLTIAADSGVDHARYLGLTVDLVVGDLDSADQRNVDWARDHGAEINEYPAAKDETDLELAIDRAAEHIADLDLDELVVVGLGGGRIDHWMANLLALGGPRAGSVIERGVKVTAIVDRARMSVIRGERELRGRPGELVSLLPLGGAASGVSTTGLVYPLDDEDLEAGIARGVSNIFDGESGGNNGGLVSAQVSVTTGTLLAIQPYAFVVDDPDSPSS